MFKQYLMLFLAMHFAGNFYYKAMAQEKHPILRPLFFYVCYCILFTIPFFSIYLAGCVMCLCLARACLLAFDVHKDPLTFSELRRRFLIWQGISIALILVLSFVLAAMNCPMNEMSFTKLFFDTIGFNETTFGKWVLALLIIDRPANTLVQRLIHPYRPDPSERPYPRYELTAGETIGTVERLIMLVLISIGQVSTIAFVMTAKSIARYDKISKDQSFAEYYLLGTLLSTVTVLITATILVR